MLRTVRIVLALIFFGFITFLFLDFRNTGPEWFDFFKSTQIIPAIFAGTAVSIIVLLLLTVIFGRIYCSVVCPLGVLQDFMGRVSGWFMKKRRRQSRFHYSKGYPWLRYAAFTAFTVAMLIGIGHMGVRAWASLVEPYSAYGRIAQSLFSPAYDYGNNILADISMANESTTFWHVEAMQYSGLVFWISLATFVVLFLCVIFAGRIWCNTICPAGTLLGFFSRFSLLAPVIDKNKCVGCRKCEKNCKSECIDIDVKKIDYSRCVTCFDCLGQCKFDSLHYTLRVKSQQQTSKSEEK